MFVTIVGLGGTGSLLAEPLLRYVHSLEQLEGATFIDGDKYESGNMGRQSFATPYVGTNKAAYATMKFSRMFPEAAFNFIDHYIGINDFPELIKDGGITFVCVDNNWFRKIIDEYVMNNLSRHVLIVSGNDMMTGQVQTVQKRGGTNITRHTVCSKHTDIANASSKEDRSEMSCEQIAALPGGGQIIAANMLSATMMLCHFIAYVQNQGTRDFYETYFNCTTCEVSSYKVRS